MILAAGAHGTPQIELVSHDRVIMDFNNEDQLSISDI